MIELKLIENMHFQHKLKGNSVLYGGAAQFLRGQKPPLPLEINPVYYHNYMYNICASVENYNYIHTRP